jgi:hypothetical protein
MLPKILSSPVVLADRVELGEGVSVNIAASRDLFYSSVSNTDEALKACVYAVRYFSSEPYPTPLEVPPGWNLKRISLRKLKIEGDVCIEPRVYILEYDFTHDICILGLEIPGAKGHSDEAHQQFLDHLFKDKQEAFLSLKPSTLPLLPPLAVSEVETASQQSRLSSGHPLSLAHITTTSLTTENGWELFTREMEKWVEVFLKQNADCPMVCERDGYCLNLAENKEIVLTHKSCVLDKVLGYLLNYHDNPSTGEANKKKVAQLLINSGEVTHLLLGDRQDMLPMDPDFREPAPLKPPSFSSKPRKPKKRKTPSRVREVLARQFKESETLNYQNSENPALLVCLDVVLHGSRDSLRSIVEVIKLDEDKERGLGEIRKLLLMAIAHPPADPSKEVNHYEKLEYLFTEVGDINFALESEGYFLNPMEAAIRSDHMDAARLISNVPGFNINHDFRIDKDTRWSPLFYSIVRQNWRFIYFFLSFPNCDVNQNNAAKVLFDHAAAHNNMKLLEKVCLHPRFDKNFLNEPAYNAVIRRLLPLTASHGKFLLGNFLPHVA